MIMINEQNLPPIMYDRIMSWASKAVAMGYNFTSPQHKALLRRIKSGFPQEHFGGDLLCHIFQPEDIQSDYPINLWYYEPISLIRCALRDPDVMKHFVLYPQHKYTLCGERVYDEITSADWFHEAFLSSPASDAYGNLIPGRLFVGLCGFDDGSVIDKLQRISEHPYLLSFMNLSNEGRKIVDSWMLISLLPDMDVSDAEIERSNDDLSLRRAKLYHSCTQILLQQFEDPSKSYHIWVHGLGWTDVYFQFGMHIGDTEQHNKICGFRGGNGLFRRHCSRDCDITTSSCDDPNATCCRKQRQDVEPLVRWALDKSAGPGLTQQDLNELIPDEVPHDVLPKKRISSDDYVKSISQLAVMVTGSLHHFGGCSEGVYGACPYELLHLFHLGLLKYILSSLYSYRSIPSAFISWINTRSNPSFPPTKVTYTDPVTKKKKEAECHPSRRTGAAGGQPFSLGQIYRLDQNSPQTGGRRLQHFLQSSFREDLSICQSFP